MIEPAARNRIELQDLEPKIWRRIDVPLSSTLAALHDIIQVSFVIRRAHSAPIGVLTPLYTWVPRGQGSTPNNSQADISGVALAALTALVMVEMNHLLLAVAQAYRYTTGGRATVSRDYKNTIFVSNSRILTGR